MFRITFYDRLARRIATAVVEALDGNCAVWAFLASHFGSQVLSCTKMEGR